MPSTPVARPGTGFGPPPPGATGAPAPPPAQPAPPPAAPATRLPGRPRERRPVLAALAVLLIVGGALTSGLIVQHSGQRADYLVLRTGLGPGEQVQDTDLGIARIAGTGARAIPAADRAAVVGRYATTRLFAGALLTRDMVAAAPSVPTGTAVVGAVLSPQQRPADGPRRGDVVGIYIVPTAAAGDGTATVLVAAAQVVDVGGPNTTGGTGLAVSLQVPAADVADATAFAAVGRLAIVALPPGTPLTGVPRTTGPRTNGPR